ncbi:unnamed protein product [Linum trigynum]|uniref:Reverse transcriptase zinc-binding domain-containing protein n=1 Tax=Linum trigynum TaxID=586398 RepID=A0AAV2GIE7_9ROSI
MEKPRPELGEDKMIWGLEQDERFQLKFVYNLIANTEDEGAEEGTWKALWRWKGPSRVKHFLWLVLHGRLFTNKERVRRKMATNSNCTYCKDTEETMEHILRNCVKAKAVWDRFRHKLAATNAIIPFHEWVLSNLLLEEKGIDFGVICWNFWKKRNKEVLDGKVYNEQSVRCRIDGWLNTIKQAEQGMIGCSVNQDNNIIWKLFLRNQAT